MKNLKSFFARLFRSPEKPTTLASGKSPAMAQKIMTMISQTADVELTCDEVFELIDQFTEMAKRGENVAELMPMVQQHLQVCPDCREEFEALKRVLDNG